MSIDSIRRATSLVSRMGDRLAPQVMELDSGARIAVWSQVDRLPLRQRQVVYLRFRADLSFDEIAQVMGITASAARSHASQAMNTLRSALGRQGMDADG